MPLSEARLQSMLGQLPHRTIGLIGDLFLDRYLEIDDALTEPSLETGLPAYQVTRVRPSPGALGTVMNNLVALGVGRLIPISVLGDDGEGYELLQCLRRIPAVDPSALLQRRDRRTPTYTKPMLHSGSHVRELSRLDIKNRSPLPADAEAWVVEQLHQQWGRCDALLVVDQVSEEDCGVITGPVRQALAVLAERSPEKFTLADSRERIGRFANVCVKPNEREARAGSVAWNRPVFETRGEAGMVLHLPGEPPRVIPAYPVRGPVDIVGAGDSCSAGIACGMVAGFTLQEAAALGNLVASVTVQQIGTTGTCSPAQLLGRWREVGG